jgi:hypothetical protein
MLLSPVWLLLIASAAPQPGAAGPGASRMALAGADVDASLGVHLWIATDARPGPSLSPRISFGYSPSSLVAGPVALRFAGTGCISFISEPAGRTTFTSILLSPGVRYAFARSVSLAIDVGAGLVLISGLRPGSVLLAPGSQGVTGTLSAVEVRPAMGMDFALTRSLAAVALVSLIWNSRPDELFGQGSLLRFETAAGLRWKF